LYSNWFGLTEYIRATGLSTLPFTLIRDTFVNMLLQVIRDAFELWCTEWRAKQYMVDQMLDISTCLKATLIVMRGLGLETPSILDGKSQGDEILNVLLSQEYDEDGVILLTLFSMLSPSRPSLLLESFIGLETVVGGVYGLASGTLLSAFGLLELALVSSLSESSSLIITGFSVHH
jgi:hypothetical protein